MIDPTRRIPKATLARTKEDYEAMGCTLLEELELLAQNPGKTMAEILTNDQILDQLRGAKELCEELKNEGSLRARSFLEITVNEWLAPNLNYLRQIGRLPTEFMDFNVLKAYALDPARA